MKNEKLLHDILAAIHASSSDELLPSDDKNTIVTCQESVKDAIFCVMSILGFEDVMRVEEFMDGPALYYRMRFIFAYSVNIMRDGKRMPTRWYDSLMDALDVAISLDRWPTGTTVEVTRTADNQSLFWADNTTGTDRFAKYEIRVRNGYDADYQAVANAVDRMCAPKWYDIPILVIRDGKKQPVRASDVKEGDVIFAGGMKYTCHGCLVDEEECVVYLKTDACNAWPAEMFLGSEVET